MRTLLINMTRFGDLVQSQAALAGLAREGAVAVACLDNFAAAAGLLDGAEAVLPLPGAGLLADVQDSRPGRGWRAALARLEGWRGTVRAFAPDRVVNLTPSIPVRLLTRLLAGLPPDVPPDGPSDGPSDGQDGAGPTPEVRGFVVDEYGFNADVGGWAAFLHTASNHRGASPFNVVDLFSRVAGLDGPGRFVLRRPGEAAQEAAARLVPEVAGVAPGARGWLAVQLGASEDRRRWPVSHFARAAERLFERRGLAPMLLGSAAETPLADRFRERCAVPALDLTGRTGLDELGAVLTRAELLLTNDTGTMHLAAGLGVPVAAVFLATAQPFDTGPYLAGALSFEPDLDCHPCPFGAPCPHGHACRRAVDPEAVAAWAVAALEGGAPDPASPPPGPRVWRACPGEDGLLDLESLSGHGGSDRALWIRAQRVALRRFLDGEPPGTFPAPLDLSPDTAAGLARTLDDALEVLTLLDGQLVLLAHKPLPQHKTRLLANWQRLDALLQAHPGLAVLGALWTRESQTRGGDLAALTALVARHRGLYRCLRSALAA